MKGIINGKKGTLIKYNEVLKKLNIPKDYLFEFVVEDEVFITVYLKKIEEIVIGKIIPNIIDIKTVSSMIRLTKNDFRKKFGLNYENFNVEVLFRKKTTYLLRIGSFSEELMYYLEKDLERVYFWISEEEVDKRSERFFVETK